MEGGRWEVGRWEVGGGGGGYLLHFRWTCVGWRLLRNEVKKRITDSTNMVMECSQPQRHGSCRSNITQSMDTHSMKAG